MPWKQTEEQFVSTTTVEQSFLNLDDYINGPDDTKKQSKKSPLKKIMNETKKLDCKSCGIKSIQSIGMSE